MLTNRSEKDVGSGLPRSVSGIWISKIRVKWRKPRTTTAAFQREPARYCWPGICIFAEERPELISEDLPLKRSGTFFSSIHPNI
jgi:hypothetical protein